MDCKAASNLVSGWLDGKLDCGEAAFLRHLNGCRACSLEMNELQAVLAALRENSVVVPAPEGFARRVMDRLQTDTLRGGSHLLLRKLTFVASFLFLLGMNSLLVGRYLGKNNQAALPPVLAPASDLTTEPVPTVPVPDPAKQPDLPAPGPPPEQKPLVTARNAAEAAYEPAPAAPAKQQEAERKQGVAFLPPAAIPDPEVFVQQRRVTEGVLLKVAVTDLTLASQRLVEAAGALGLTPVMTSETLAADGRLIKVCRYEVPYLQADMFVADTLKLGRVLEERHLKEDVSDEYGQKLEQYRQLAARALEAEGAEAEELHLMINALLLELAGMHSTSGDMKAVTIWLES
jgi:hypothetical protein